MKTIVEIFKLGFDMLSNQSKMFLMLLSLVLVPVVPALAAEQGENKILPKSTKTTISGPNDENRLAIPLRIFFEYGMSSAVSDSNPLGRVDVDVNKFTAGVDFITSSLWFWGLSLSYVMTEDNGSSVFAPSIKTDKDIGGGSIYIARQVKPGLLAGISGYFSRADGKSVFNGADVVTEKSNFYGFSPFLKLTLLKSDDVKITTGAKLNVGFGDFDYVANIPPSSNTRSVVLQVPLTISRDFGDNLSLSVSATLNQELSRTTFTNVPAPDKSTVTLGAYAAYRFDNGTSIYARGR